MTVKLEARGLGKTYGQFVALQPTDIQVKEGEFLTLLGPSGSGKTTLLQMISGLVLPSSGQLLIDGQDATHTAPGKRGMGLVFQSYALFPHMSVWDNVAYGLRMRRLGKAEIKTAVDDALAMVRMQDFAHRYPNELSGGQQQRIALARCFAYRPSVILLDEPLGALDKNLREHMQLEIRHMHKELGATFIYVTHDQEEALTLSDRICLMNRARIEQLATPQELYDRPATRFAAEFIGHSNVLSVRRENSQQFAIEGSLVDLGGCVGGEVAQGVAEEAFVLVRPEAARLTEPAQGLLVGHIDECVFLGSDTRALIRLPSGARFSVRCERQLTPRVGDQVGITWDAQRATLLAGEARP
ncbi:ABC transporter ATP-binding protein [Pseudomonas syringae]|uniref:ABC transporter n=1 Tax=Pseudomonas syringae TaxID=317 RepID=A0A085V5D7_PSESX|nr:ABC transporter ATP-binding protein [Pseudomonas syringae]KFE50650.1 ABC transporter [Pseudomonas syringae]